MKDLPKNTVHALQNIADAYVQELAGQLRLSGYVYSHGVMSGTGL